MSEYLREETTKKKYKIMNIIYSHQTLTTTTSPSQKPIE